MRHVSLTCKNHPNLRWSCKEIAFTDEGGYNGMRNYFFKGKIKNPIEFYPDMSGVECHRFTDEKGNPITECSCSSQDLIRAPEDNQIK